MTSANATTGKSRRAKLPLSESHEIFRASARRFFETECAPFQRDWEKDGHAPRVIWARAGELGFLCLNVPEEFGGQHADFLYSVILAEEQARAGVMAPALSQQSEGVASYISVHGTGDQKKALLPRMARGEVLGALAIAEPSSAGDAGGIKARRDGDGYVLTGNKRFVIGGASADLVIAAAQTEAGFSLFVVEVTNTDGIVKGLPIKKLGLAALDCVDIRFEHARVPASSLLGGDEGRGAEQIRGLQRTERLLAAAASVATIDRAIALTVQYVKDRKAFNQRILDFQNTRFRLAEAKTEATVLRIYLERCLRGFLAGTLSEAEAAMLAFSTAEKQCAIVDDCVQLHGGYGYILDFAIARLWTDGRLNKLLACTDEMMSDIVGPEPKRASDRP